MDFSVISNVLRDGDIQFPEYQINLFVEVVGEISTNIGHFVNKQQTNNLTSGCSNFRLKVHSLVKQKHDVIGVTLSGHHYEFFEEWPDEKELKNVIGRAVDDLKEKTKQVKLGLSKIN